MSHKQDTLSLYNKRTNWDTFKEILSQNINYNIPLKAEEELEAAIEDHNYQIHIVAWKATPNDDSRNIKIKINERIKLRKQWRLIHSPHDKANI